MESHEIVIYALLGGIIPAIIWLKFWLKEDGHQEPRKLILGSFLAGFVGVIIALVAEHFVQSFTEEYTLISLSLWALTEELVKFFGAYFVALRTRFVNEPVDAIIYLISSALGFSAFENTLFLLDPFTHGEIARGIATINLRFIGATLLHVVSTGVIGLAIGYAFYKTKFVQRIFLISSIVLATILHTLFNSFIIMSEQNIFVIFSGIWIGLVVVILTIDKIKRIKKINY